MAGPLETIKTEWSVIKSAPWSFVFTAVAAFSASYGALHWYYEGEVLHLQTELSELKARGVPSADVGSRPIAFQYEQRSMSKTSDGQFVTRITFSPQRAFQKVQLLVVCDGEISAAKFTRYPAAGAFFNDGGSVMPDRHSYALQFTTPAPEPTAIIVDLTGKEDLRVIRVEGGGV